MAMRCNDEMQTYSMYKFFYSNCAAGVRCIVYLSKAEGEVHSEVEERSRIVTDNTEARLGFPELNSVASG